METQFKYRGWTEKRRIASICDARVDFDDIVGEELISKITMQVGKKKHFDEDVPVEVIVTVREVQ